MLHPLVLISVVFFNIIITNVGGYFTESPTVYVNNDPTIAVAAIQDGRLAEIRIKPSK